MFRFKQFIIQQDKTAMKVTTDSCLFGAWLTNRLGESFGQSVLDIGTGTGLLSLMFGQKNPNAIIDAIEIDAEAAQQAKENVEQSPWGERINVTNADIRRVADTLPAYDIVICNPPFHENQLSSDSYQKNTAHHSTELSLEDLLRIIPGRLKEEGK